MRKNFALMREAIPRRTGRRKYLVTEGHDDPREGTTHLWQNEDSKRQKVMHFRGPSVSRWQYKFEGLKNTLRKMQLEVTAVFGTFESRWINALQRGGEMKRS